MKYIWIDALCIPQDDGYEKELEISRMPLYYRKNTATLCAASAEACDVGFLGREHDVPFGVGPFEISIKTPDGIGAILLYDTLDILTPTTFRAWTLQESLLSRRLLICSPGRLVWCCLSGNAGYGGSLGTLTRRNLGHPPSLSEDIYPLEVLEDMPARVQWKKIVENYTRRGLTNQGDKLLAVAAIASVIHSMDLNRDRRTSVYLAGLLAELKNGRVASDSFSEVLSWMTVQPTATRARSFCAPSWSWACIDGVIQPNATLMTRTRSRSKREVKHRFQVLDYGVDLTIPAAPYGAVTGGYLKIKGLIWELHDFEGVRVDIEESPWDSGRAPVPAGEWRVTLYPDTKEDAILIENAQRNAGEVFLLETNLNVEGPLSSGLLVAPEPSQAAFRRIGLFRHDLRGGPDDHILNQVVLSNNNVRELLLV
jgi:hypothetical protein